MRAATGPQLVACAVAATVNARGLLNDAQVLAGAGCKARAYSLAALAVEECGKAAVMCGLAIMPRTLRAQAPVGRLLEWHQLKQVGGLLMAAAPFGWDLASKLAAMNAAELAQILSALEAPADEADRLKRRGLYVDMDRNGRIREPSNITEAEVSTNLARAVQTVSSASTLLDPAVQARVTNPPAEAIQLSLALVRAFTEAGGTRTPKAAAQVIHKAVSELRDQTALIDVGGPPKLGGLPPWPEDAHSLAEAKRRRG